MIKSAYGKRRRIIITVQTAQAQKQTAMNPYFYFKISVAKDLNFTEIVLTPQLFKGTVSQDFLLLVFFHESVSPQPQSNPLETF